MTGISENNCNRKKLPLEKKFQVNGFQQRENPSPIARIKDFFKNTFLVHGKKVFLQKTYKKWSARARKSVSTTRNEAVVKNTFPLYEKNASCGKKIEENGFHLQENVLLLKLVPSNFNNVFQQQRKQALNKSILFPLDRKYVST